MNKKYFYTLILSLVVVISVFVTAYDTTNPESFGHTAGEIAAGLFGVGNFTIFGDLNVTGSVYASNQSLYVGANKISSSGSDMQWNDETVFLVKGVSNYSGLPDIDNVSIGTLYMSSEGKQYVAKTRGWLEDGEPCGTCTHASMHTGQTTNYSTGDDADNDGTSKSYHDPGDGTITDLLTGLMWVREDSGSQINWVSALGYCNDITTGGYIDWRVPDYYELFTMADFSCNSTGGNCADAYLNNAFNWTSTSYAMFWSSTTRAADGSVALVFRSSLGDTQLIAKSSTSYVRCVRDK